ncbi:urea carboxylase-associated family protein [Streptomyces asoensis]|uniref:urea carboxylase-associated family protein n=1 Tax=Streptomyces asoensis TaxID=249586 RepID=UPI0033E56343
MTAIRAIEDRIEIPAGTGEAIELAAGQVIQVVDADGRQVADLFAFVRDNSAEYHSAPHTRAFTNRLFPKVGEPFVTNQRRPILTLIADDSPGRHDMLIPACDPSRYRELGAPDGHSSCSANLVVALGKLGITPPITPQPINAFMDIPVGPGGNLTWNPATTRAGDSITLRAEMDCVLVVSACPQDLVGINSGAPTPLVVQILKK